MFSTKIGGTLPHIRHLGLTGSLTLVMCLIPLLGKCMASLEAETVAEALKVQRDEAALHSEVCEQRMAY